MQISSLNSWSRQIGVTAITGYQRHISPHKGFSCAHRLLYGDESCSQYVKRVIAQEGLKVAFVKSRARFQACKQANHILRCQRLAQSSLKIQDTAQQKYLMRLQNDDLEPTEEEVNIPIEEGTPTQPTKKSLFRGLNGKDCNCCVDSSCNGAELLTLIPDCSTLDCGAASCHGLDCSGLDCGALDCGALDCGGADCGSCGG